jgi:hypothetical protein
MVDIFIHRPWRRLEGTPALVAAASVGRLPAMVDSLSTTYIGPQPDDADDFTVDDLVAEKRFEEKPCAPVTLFGGDHLPARVVQVGGHKVGYTLHRAQLGRVGGEVFMKREGRDFGALVRLLTQRIGPGVILTADRKAVETFLLTHEIEGCRVMDFYSCNAAALLGNPLPKAIRWAFAVGFRRVCMQEVLARVVALPPDQWPSILGDDLAEGLQEVASSFRMRDGRFEEAPEWMAPSSRSRQGSVNPELDNVLMTMVAESVEYLAASLAEMEREDGLPRTLGLMTDHPMAGPDIKREGAIMLDELRPWNEVMPSAGFVWTRDGTCGTMRAAAKRADMHRVVLQRECKERDSEAAVRYWLEPLGDDVDGWLQAFDA